MFYVWTSYCSANVFWLIVSYECSLWSWDVVREARQCCGHLNLKIIELLGGTHCFGLNIWCLPPLFLLVLSIICKPTHLISAIYLWKIQLWRKNILLEMKLVSCHIIYYPLKMYSLLNEISKLIVRSFYCTLKIILFFRKLPSPWLWR